MQESTMEKRWKNCKIEGGQKENDEKIKRTDKTTMKGGGEGG
jgi:hypothetical protein